MDMLGFGMRVAAGAGMCFASHAAEIRIEAPKRTCDWDLAPLSFSMANCRLSFSKPQTEVFSASNVRAITLSNVTISGVSAPLVRTWDGRPEVRLSNAKGAALKLRMAPACTSAR